MAENARGVAALADPGGPAGDAAGTVDAVAAGNILDDPAMTIGEVAREFGMTLRALRFYESKQLIAPQRHGTTRLYHRSERKRLTLILIGRRLGFTLAEIKHLVGKPGSNALQLSRVQCVEQINLLERQKRGLEVAIAELRQIYTSYYTMRLSSGGSEAGTTVLTAR